MKKHSKRLTLAKETLKHLNDKPLAGAVGEAAVVGTNFGCPDTWYQCSTYCG